MHYCHCGIAIVIAIVIDIVIDIVTSAEDSSEPVGKEQCCRQQNMNYVIVALTAHYSTNCSHRQFDLVLAGAGGVAVGVAVAVGMMKPCMIPMHDGMMRLAFSCLNNSSVLIQVIS